MAVPTYKIGMLEFYNNNISHTSNHTDCFKNCGKDTAEGLFALKQIPVSWGGFKIDTANTLRFWFSNDSTNPSSIENGGTWTKIVNHPEGNVWDWTCEDTDWESKFDGTLTSDIDPSIRIIAAGDTSNVTNMSWMFWGCRTLTEVPLFDTSNVTNMFGMFQGCTALTEVPLFDTSNVTDMSSMFAGCTALASIPLFDTSNVTDMIQLFQGCTALTSVPLFNTSNVANMSRMFNSCSSLAYVPLLDTSNVTDMSNMFYDCINVETGALALYQAAVATGKVSIHTYAFTNCGKDTTIGLAELQQIPESWGGLAAG